MTSTRFVPLRAQGLCTRCRSIFVYNSAGRAAAAAASCRAITTSASPSSTSASTATSRYTRRQREELVNRNLRTHARYLSILEKSKMASLYGDDTPDSIKNAKGLHLITQSTPNGQKVQIFLEELKQHYGSLDFDTTVIVSNSSRQKTKFTDHTANTLCATTRTLAPMSRRRTGSCVSTPMAVFPSWWTTQSRLHSQSWRRQRSSSTWRRSMTRMTCLASRTTSSAMRLFNGSSSGTEAEVRDTRFHSPSSAI